MIAVILILAALALLIFSQRYAWWRPAVDYRYPRILMYHMVAEHRKGARFNKLRVRPGMFERQVRWLKEQGWHFASMTDLMQNRKLPEKTVVITFDDGYADNYLQAYPVLKKYGAKATLYLVVDRFDRDWSTSKKAHHDSGELMHEPKLSDDQVREMLASGLVELGGHTLTHANLAKLDREARTREVVSGREQLQQTFGQPVSSFAYPFGIYDEQDVSICAEAGFLSAVTTEEGINRDRFSDPYRLKRVKISGKDSMLAFRLRMKTGQRGWKR
ncbi:polysaccharide deacetylase family protein [Sedimenticola thiotaurini]|uniref:Polysaccharide deacetylase n=1 Tax=Sedimenticola thiotaurini TaxID=1543721 RepID=A0A0F7K109_9GAMM|nr:polysaccharide deacetylase family protein [Sedimenticola thiotaurini]AKH20860.1 polysaccharide deacetylase [Sedimenticola thiotaurini]